MIAYLFKVDRKLQQYGAMLPNCRMAFPGDTVACVP